MQNFETQSQNMDTPEQKNTIPQNTEKQIQELDNPDKAAELKELVEWPLLKELNPIEDQEYLRLNNISSRTAEVTRLGDTNEYKPADIDAKLSSESKNNWHIDSKTSSAITDTKWSILSMENTWKNTQWESVGTCFYKNCNCSKFSSSETCTINEHYDANGNVDRADAPVEYNQAA